jgi:hypothetical protein
MVGADFIMAQLALKAWQDGHQDGLNGMMAVAFTIRNRVRAGWFGGDWIQVLSHHNDWSATDFVPSELPDPRQPAFKALLQEVNGIFYGIREDDITVYNLEDSVLAVKPSPALYYARLSDPNIKEWFLTNISRNHEQHKLIAQVGTLYFFN